MPVTILPFGYTSGVNVVKSVSGVATFDMLGVSSKTPTTPTLAGGANVQQISLTENTTAAVTGFSAASGTSPRATSNAGQRVTFIIVQNASAAKTWTWPANVIGGMTISATLSSINVQTFVISNAGLTLYACDAGITGMTGGTP